MQHIIVTLMIAALCALAFGLGWLAHSQTERKREKERQRIRRITQERRTPARPGTTPSTVRKATIDRGAEPSTIGPTNLTDKRK